MDAPEFLAARLMDMLVNNWDRHPGQWKWARFGAGKGEVWEPISRDQDKAFISVHGFLPAMLRMASPDLVTFDSTYPGMRSLTWNSLALDRRLLNGLGKPVWDSVARALAGRISDAVIASALQAMPKEYWTSAPAIAGKLRARRDALPAQADRFYRYLAGTIDIHETDEKTRTTITRIDGGFVDVQQGPAGAPGFLRRFDARETSSIRLYLHGGADSALITGDVRGSIPLYVIGGNGANDLLDSSHVDGRSAPSHLFDAHTTSGVSYGTDTLFDRRPMIREFGGLVTPGHDYGSAFAPTAGLSINRDMGVEPRLGFTSYHYGVRDAPYSSMLSLEGRYSFKIGGSSVALSGDQRVESSALHFTELVQTSQLEMVNWHGLGNASPESPGMIANVSAPRTDFYALNQRQWLLQPAVALALAPTTDLSFGPVLKYVVTDSTPDRFVSQTLPYGSGHFGEAGLALSLTSDVRSPPRHAHHGTLLDLGAAWYPALWDVKSRVRRRAC